jgi:hypothetical protein
MNIWKRLVSALPAAWAAEKQFIFICLGTLIFLWAYSIFDAYMSARNARSS